MTTRTVEYMLDKALRVVGQATKFKSASTDDLDRSFQSFIDMLDLWENDEGILLYGNRPDSINSQLGSEDPIIALWSNLVMYIAADFAYDYTPQDASRAASSKRTVRNRALGLPRMNRPSRMPRGSNNYWYNYYFLNPDGSRCDGGQVIVTNGNAPLVTE